MRCRRVGITSAWRFLATQPLGAAACGARDRVCGVWGGLDTGRQRPLRWSQGCEVIIPLRATSPALAGEVVEAPTQTVGLPPVLMFGFRRWFRLRQR